MTSAEEKFIQKGFVPVSRNSDLTVLKSNQGIVLAYNDGHSEGILKGYPNNTQMDEANLRQKILTLLLTGLGITYFSTDLTVINGNSMAPTYHTGKIIIRSKLVRKVNELLSRDAVIRFRSPQKEICIKRVVGVPGDEIKFDGPRVYINGKLIDSDNNIGNMEWQQHWKPHEHNSDFSPTVKLEKDQFYVMGDNRRESEDSRDYGPIFKSSIIAVVDKK